MDELTAPVAALADFRDGTMVGAEVSGVPVMVCQVDGQLYAVSGYCTHARQLLYRGRLRGFEVSCPLHGGRFDVRDGACKAAPATRALKTFPVWVEAGKVWVRVSAEDRPAAPKFGPV